MQSLVPPLGGYAQSGTAQQTSTRLLGFLVVHHIKNALDNLYIVASDVLQSDKLYQRRPQTEQCSKMRSPNNMASSIS